jgi:hypothetical protein
MGNKNNSNRRENCVLSYTNGDKYDGEVVNGVREGYGTYFYHNGDKYEGMWINNKKHGMGTLYYKDGNLYIGQWKNSEKEGIGSIYLKNGEKYYGEFKTGKRNGKGVLISPDHNKFTGYFKENRKNGVGIMVNTKSKKKSKEQWNIGVLVGSEILMPDSEDEEEDVFQQDNSFENYIDDQINFLKNLKSHEKLKSKYFTLEVAKYFKARIPNNYFEASQFVALTSDLIYENPHVIDWSEDEVCQWLYRLGLYKHEKVFKENNINGIRFIKVNILDLKETLKVDSLTDIKLILKSIDFLRIFVKLKLDYEENMMEGKAAENLIGTGVQFLSSGHKKSKNDEEETHPHGNNKLEVKSHISHNPTTASNNEKKSEDDPQDYLPKKKATMDTNNLNTKINESEEIVIENQEFFLTKAAISKYILTIS